MIGLGINDLVWMIGLGNSDRFGTNDRFGMNGIGLVWEIGLGTNDIICTHLYKNCFALICNLLNLGDWLKGMMTLKKLEPMCFALSLWESE